MLSLEGLIEGISSWSYEVEAHCPSEDYWKLVAEPWFRDIGPSRARAYGVRGLNELGLVGITAQVFNCYYRWERMESLGVDLEEELDTLRDALGYAVLAGIVGGVTTPEQEGWWWESWDVNEPEVWYRLLRQYVWSREDEGMAPRYAWPLALGVFNRTWIRMGNV